jgi:cell division protein DivIC
MKEIHCVLSFIRKWKYLITVIIFILVVGLFDKNSFLHRYENQREMVSLQKEIQKYRNKYNQASHQLLELDSNPEAIKKIARERYFMKKENEDVFVFANESEDSDEEAQ